MINRIRGKLSSALLAGASAIAIVSATPAAAQDATRSFDIPAQSLSSALLAYSRQSDTPVIASMDLLKGKTAPAVHGELPQQLALTMLLEGSGLRAVQGASGGIVVERIAPDPQGASAAGGGAEVEALIVTAQKREEDIQDVPIAISAFTQEALERSQVAGGPDLMTQVPNMTFTKTNFSSYSIQLRGIGTQAISATVDPAVAVAFNNTPFIRNRFFEQEFYDLQRVEVLRGPQGTLYGRNATAGVVNIISQKPKFAYEAKISGDVANYSTMRLEGMVNVPLVDDIVALRLAGAWTKREGYATNEITGTPIDGRDLWSTRVSLRVAPTDALDLNLIWEHFEEDDDRLRSGKQLCKRHKPDTIAGLPIPWGESGPGSNNGALYDQTFSQGCEAASLYSPDSFQVPNGLRLPYYRALSGINLPIVSQNAEGTAFDPYASTVQSHDLRVIESTVEPIYQANSDLVELQASFDVTDRLTLSSETGWMSDELFASQDYNRFNTRPGAFRVDNFLIERNILDEEGNFCDPQIGCANRVVAMDLSTAKSTQFSQELRLASDYEGPFNFSLGANFLRYDTIDKYYVFINTLSLQSVVRAYQGHADYPSYEPGVTDNSHCLEFGYRPPDINGAEDVVDCVFIDNNPIRSLNDRGHNYFLSNNPYKLISYAIFGEAYYNLADELKLTAGLRWTADKKEAPRIPSWVLAADSAGYPVAEIIEQEWREPTGRVTLDWKPDLTFTDETLLYASYAHGYKAGGANPPAAGLTLYCTGCVGLEEFTPLAVGQQAVAPRTFEPEFIDAFELGSKNTLLDGKLTLNAAAFYYDYKGYQISQIVNRSAINLNFDAAVWGLELEADWRPLDNLRFGLKGGYESTRMADGSRAIDVMDRANGGKPDENGVSWFVTAPFPSLPSNCILPTYLVTRPGDVLAMLGMAGGGQLGACEIAYVLGKDPLTSLDYVENPPNPGDTLYWYEGYQGFDPSTAPNGGAGIYKDLSGNELPNAPHYTATLTADYTIPLPNDWLATLHTDLYYQSEAWTRVFNTEGYDKLKAYTNVNLAAIFANDDAGWKVMAYVKNVFDRDSITGAFLNSDDTGLTTNVFLTEPRLYGLRVTKGFSGGPWWTGANLNHEGPYPLTVEVSGQVQRHDAPYETLGPVWASTLPETIATDDLQHRDLDNGDGRSLKLTWRPNASPWSLSAGIRYGRTNTNTARENANSADITELCRFSEAHPFAAYCEPPFIFYGVLNVQFWNYIETQSWSEGEARSAERHEFVDFAVGHDFGIGGLTESAISVGMRFADFHSETSWAANAQTDWDVPVGWGMFGPQYESSFKRRHAKASAQRDFDGAGPVLSWDAAMRVWGDDRAGHLDVDWSVGGGVLFGEHETIITGEDKTVLHQGSLANVTNTSPDRTKSVVNDLLPEAGPATIVPINIDRSADATVPLLDLSLGVAYQVGRVRVGAGYRWERYFDVLDVGYEGEQARDRIIDGPYFKLAIGFGG